MLKKVRILFIKEIICKLNWFLCLLLVYGKTFIDLYKFVAKNKSVRFRAPTRILIYLTRSFRINSELVRIHFP